MSRQRGFGAIAAIIVLVILAALAAAIVAIGTSQQTAIAQDIRSARAGQVARAGTEWGLYQALQPAGVWFGAGGPCPAGGALGAGVDVATTIDLTAATGFAVTVTASCWRYNEGQTIVVAPPLPPALAPTVINVYRIQAVACPVAGGCPSAAVASPGYVERTRVVIATN